MLKNGHSCAVIVVAKQGGMLATGGVAGGRGWVVRARISDAGGGTSFGIIVLESFGL